MARVSSSTWGPALGKTVDLRYTTASIVGGQSTMKMSLGLAGVLGLVALAVSGCVTSTPVVIERTTLDAGIDSGLMPGDASPPEEDDGGVRPLRVMVTNDDGYSSAGIDALVEALWAQPEVVVSVVAPAYNQSGTGGSTTPGELTATDAHTGAGRPAKAVAGYPADCVAWAVDQHGLPHRPDVVISGINHGDNAGPVIEISGTVGAARAAAARSIPALAVSSVTNGSDTDFTAGAVLVVRWLSEHRAAIASGEARDRRLLEALNIPNCPPATFRGVVHAPVAPENNGVQVDCESTVADPKNDVEALNAGFAVISPLPPKPPGEADASM